MLGNSPVVPEASNKDENIMATNELSSLFDSAGAVGDYVVIDGEDTSSERKSTPQTGGNESHKMDTTETLQKETIVSSSPPKETPTEATSTSGDSIYILKRLFSNWSCVVTTILGYFPSCLHQDDKCPEDSASCQFTLEPGHVAHLDNFVQMLLYSRHKFLLYEFIKTVIHHMNADMADVNVELIYAKILSNSEVTLSKKTVGVVVGCVLLRSLVRLLTVEHSRPNGVTMTVTSSNSSSEASPSPDIPTSSRAQRNGTNDQKQILEVYKALKSTVRVFGSLSLLAMATACDGMMSPVRVGLTKPLGASSVCAEYQKGAPSRSTSYYRPISERGMQEYPHSTQLRQHIRSSTSYRLRQTSPHPLPQEGFRLRPKLGVSGVEMGDETMDDSVMDDGMDEEWGASETSKLPQTIQTLFSSVSFSPTNAFHSLIDEELSIVDNSDSSDSSEDSMLLIHDILPPSRQTGNGNGDQNPQSSVYEHAWALDGRVLGETFRGSSQPPIDVFDPYMDTKLTSVSSIPSIRFGAAFLTRTHTRLLKDLVDLALCLGESKDVEIDGEKLPMVSLPDGLFESVTEKVFDLLEPSWQWMCQLLDIAEGQLQQATNFDTEHFVHALRGTTRNGSQLPSSMLSRSSTTHTGGIIGSSPAEYVMYLLRAHTHESQGVLPVLDLYGYEHVVYTLDGFMYLLGKWPKEVNTEGGSTSSPRVVHNAKQEEPGSLVPEQETSSKSVHPKTKASSPNPSENFFRRSISVSTVGNPELGVSSAKYGEASFNRSVTEEIPLADQPHLLGLRLEGTSTPKKATNSPVISAGLPVSLSGLSSSQSRKHFADLTVEEVVHRWQTAIDVFAHVFLVEGPGSEQNNFLYAHAGVASRMARFRHQVSVLRDNMVSAREFGSSSSTLSVRVRRSNLLQDGLDLLKNMTNFRYQQVRVKFDGEDGSGPGVNRGFFTTFAHALKTNEKTKGGRLLHEPGKLPEQTGLFAPCPLCDGLSKKDKEDRKLLFVAIGRFLGLCLWFRQTIPLMICRHVAKFLLGRELAWHDLAFFNSNLYEGFRRMLLDAQEKSLSPEDFKSTYCCYFEAPFGDNSVELTPGGRKVPVTPTNVKEYVHLYAMFVMVDCIKEEMAALKTGLHDIIPSDLLSGITAEDFQLLLSGGCENISLSKLKSCVRFHHSHSGSKNISQRFEKMFWKVISQMTNSQRQQLLYFATGSSAMPLLNSGDAHGTQITIEVMGSNLESLPIASTCSQRISIPLYPSLHILRRKLHQAIQCQGYGLA
jgi:E3 ubiquitin-protein ligase EDD1